MTTFKNEKILVIFRKSSSITRNNGLLISEEETCHTNGCVLSTYESIQNVLSWWEQRTKAEGLVLGVFQCTPKLLFDGQTDGNYLLLIGFALQ